MSGAVKFIAGIALMAVGIATGNLVLAKAGFYLANVGLLEEASKLFTPSEPKAKVKQDVEYAGTVTPRRILYGKLRISGLNTVRPIVTGLEGKMLHQVLTLCGHRVNSISTVWFNQDAVGTIAAVTGTASDGLVSTGTFADLAWVRRYTGTESQTVDYILNQAAPSLWPATNRGRSVAYIALQYKLSEKAYGSGKPDVTALVEGKIVYDPRLDTSPGTNPTSTTYAAYSANPALCLADYLVDPWLGCGIDPAKIDWTLVVTAANECDELVSIPGSTTQKRYTCSVILDASGVRREDNIKALAGAMLGICYRQGGLWRMYAGAAQSPSFTLTEADIVGDYSFRRETPIGEKHNFVRGTFIDADRQYQEVEYEPRQESAYETADGVRLSKTASFLTCTNAYEAQRNAIILLRRSRMRETLTARFALSAFTVRPFMVGTMTLAEVGWSAQRVVCTSWRFLEDGTVEMQLQEDSTTIWTDPDVGDYSAPGTGGSNTSTAYTPSAPTSLTVKQLQDSILFTWTKPSDTIPGDVCELFEHTSASPFASATKVWEGVASSATLSRPDTTQRYYWVRMRSTNTNPSSPEPSGNGVPARVGEVSGTLSAAPSTNSVSLSGTGTTVTSAAVVVTPQGGTSPYTYAWTKLSGGSITITSSSAASTTFSAASLASGESRTATFRCTVTDNVAATATCDVVVTLARSAMSVSISPTGLYKNGTTASLTTASATATASGGQPSYTYAWTKVSGDAITITSAASASTTFSAASMVDGEMRVAVFRCTATDSTGGTPLTATADIAVTIDRENI